MTYFFQCLFSAFSFIGMGFMFVLVLYKLNRKAEMKVDINYALAITLLFGLMLFGVAFFGGNKNL